MCVCNEILLIVIGVHSHYSYTPTPIRSATHQLELELVEEGMVGGGRRIDEKKNEGMQIFNDEFCQENELAERRNIHPRC